jgi:hypothetical protein
MPSGAKQIIYMTERGTVKWNKRRLRKEKENTSHPKQQPLPMNG